MNLKITGHHIEVTPAIREYVTEKITKVTRHFDQVIDVNVILSVEKLVQKAEVNVHVSGKDICKRDADLYATIDSLSIAGPPWSSTRKQRPSSRRQGFRSRVKCSESR
jgi:putative sigma-54 modulation protein